MVASLKFESAAGIEAINLQDTRIVTLEDSGGSIYTLDITTNDLKVEYTPQGGQKVEKTINGLATALGKLLTIDGGTAGKSVLAEEVAKKPVVDALIPELAKDDGATGIYTKKGVDDELAKKADTISLDNKADKSYVDTELAKKADTSALDEKANTEDVYTKQNVDDELEKKADTTALDNKADKSYVDTELAKKANINASNLIDAANQKAFAEAILPAKDGQKSILVTKLGEALDRVKDNAEDKVYGAPGQEKIAKDFLADKGLKPTPTDVATELIKNQAFKAEFKMQANAQDPEFQAAVKTVMSQPSFEIPKDLSEALSWDW